MPATAAEGLCPPAGGAPSRGVAQQRAARGAWGWTYISRLRAIGGLAAKYFWMPLMSALARSFW